MAGDFAERIDRLAEQVGAGELQAKVVYDQVYAHYQHEGLEFSHIEGEALYLTKALHEGGTQWVAELAAHVFEDLNGAMEDVVEDLAKDSGTLAPKDLSILSRSDHATVTSDGSVIYDRAPEVSRLSDKQLEELHRGRRLRPRERAALERKGDRRTGLESKNLLHDRRTDLEIVGRRKLGRPLNAEYPNPAPPLVPRKRPRKRR